MNRAADARDDEEHHQAQRIKPQPEIDLQITDLEPRENQLAPLRFPAGGRDENEREQKTDHHRANRELRAEFAVLQRTQRDARRGQKRQEQNNPGNEVEGLHPSVGACGRRGRVFAECHGLAGRGFVQSFIEVRSSTCADLRLRKSATISASPTATSAAATVMMKNTIT